MSQVYLAQRLQGMVDNPLALDSQGVVHAKRLQITAADVHNAHNILGLDLLPSLRGKTVWRKPSHLEDEQQSEFGGGCDVRQWNPILITLSHKMNW